MNAIRLILFATWLPLIGWISYERGCIDTNHQWTARFNAIKAESDAVLPAARAELERSRRINDAMQKFLDSMKPREVEARRT